MDDAVLRIYTLGSFEIYIGKERLKADLGRASKMWDLFKFIITNRERQIPVENFFDVLWEEDDGCMDPAKALQNHIYRLRTELHRSLGRENHNSPVKYSQGCYSWNKEYASWFDCDEFEQLYKRACEVDGSEAIDLYHKAIDLYKGEYLPELLYSRWIIPIRDYYRIIFIKCVSSISELLRKSKRHEENIEICINAARIEKYEERFHIWLMESFIEQGKSKAATDHYEYITSMLFRELGIRPSYEMKRIYKAAKRIHTRDDVDLDQITQMLDDDTNKTDGALLCDIEGFRHIYNHTVRNSNRIKRPVVLVLLKTGRNRSHVTGQNEYADRMDHLQNMIINGLRKGDAITKLNDDQFLILLPYLTFEQAEGVISRIKVGISGQYKTDGLILDHAVKMVFGKSDDLNRLIANSLEV